MFTQNHADENAGKDRIAGRAGSLSKAGRPEASHAAWIFEAIEELRGDGSADRVGVWLQGPRSVDRGESEPATFRGEVWEEGIGTGVLEWTRLTADVPLSIATLREGLSCEYEIEEQETGAIVGPELQLLRVAWVPVLVRNVLRGLVMLGSRERKKELPLAKAEKVAEKFAVLLELEEERRLAKARKADLDFWLRMRRMLCEQQNTNMILGQLAESCTRGEAMGGTGAVFALIGERKSGPSATALTDRKREDHLLVRAQSGEATWAYSVNGGPLEALWREASDRGNVAVAEADPLPLAKEISRFVAIPVERGNEIVGVLLAGLPRHRATLETVDRLVLRAALAGELFEHEQRVCIESQQRVWQQTLLEASDEPAILLDACGLVAAMSRGARSLLQRGGGEFVENGAPQRFAELFLPRHWEEIQAWVENGGARDAGKAERLEVELKCGTQVGLTRLLISGNEFSAAILEPVQGVKKTVRTMKETFEALQQAIEWLEEGVVVFGEGGEILARNAMFLQLLGLNEEEGRRLPNLDELIRVSSQNAKEPKMFAADWRTLSQSCTDGTQEELAMAHPVPQTIERYARPILGPTGKRVGRVEVYRGMSGWRAFQSKMVQTESLASLGQSVTRIVHELNNPLTTIVGNAQRLLQREKGNGHVAEAAQILQEAERASGIVRQLLNLPRETRPDLQLVSLNELIKSTVELQRPSLAGSRLRLRTELEEGLPRVRGDQSQLQQVLLNLLQNAQQAMQESGKGSVLTVRTHCKRLGRVALEVQDDGPGIPNGIQAMIFDPFFSTKPPGKGTGLGLAIVSGFVRQHGGTISLSSPVQGGACFVVELPAAEESWQGTRSAKVRLPQPPAELTVAPFESEVAGPTKLHGGSRILVVEDEPTVAALIGDVLRDTGMEVDVSPNAERALELAQRESYDLVICDLRMPGMDGQDFFGALQQAQNPLRDHILFVTGDRMTPRTREFLARHQLPHVDKPFRVEELCLAVRSLLWGKLPAAGKWQEAGEEENLGTGRVDEGNSDSAK